MILFQRFLCLLLGLLFFGYMGVSTGLAEGARPDKPAEVKSPPAQAETSPAPEISPKDRLLGLDAAQVATLLGPASLRRSENGAHVWQYVRGGCVLNLFLFRRPPQPGLRVQYLDAAPRSRKPGEMVTPVERQRCLRLFLARPAPTEAK